VTDQQLAALRSEAVYAYPLRPWSYIKTDAYFLERDYYDRFGVWHRGVDLNGKHGGDTDLGHPVQSMFPGVVVKVDNSSGFGQTVLVRSLPWVAEGERPHHLLGIEAGVEDLLLVLRARALGHDRGDGVATDLQVEVGVVLAVLALADGPDVVTRVDGDPLLDGDGLQVGVHHVDDLAVDVQGGQDVLSDPGE